MSVVLYTSQSLNSVLLCIDLSIMSTSAHSVSIASNLPGVLHTLCFMSLSLNPDPLCIDSAIPNYPISQSYLKFNIRPVVDLYFIYIVSRGLQPSYLVSGFRGLPKYRNRVWSFIYLPVVESRSPLY